MRFCSVEMGSFYLASSKTVSTPPKRTVWRVVAADCAVSHRGSAGALDGTNPLLTADEVWGYLPGEREKYVFTVSGTKACLVWQTVKQ